MIIAAIKANNIVRSINWVRVFSRSEIICFIDTSISINPNIVCEESCGESETKLVPCFNFSVYSDCSEVE